MLTNRSIPRSSVIPELPYPDVAKAVEWLCDAFGFTVRVRIANHRAQLNVGDGAVVIIEQPPGPKGPEQKLDGRSYLLVRIEDVHSHHSHARQRGAQILRPPNDYPYGERQYTVQDFAGHVWTFSQSIADVAPEDWGGVSGQL